MLATFSTIALSVGAVYAQEEQPTPEEVGVNAGLGSISGILWGGLGWAVSKSRGRTFEPMNFLATVVIGIIITAVSAFLGITATEAEGMIFSVGLTAIVDKIFSFAQKPKQSTTVASTHQ